MTFLQMKSKGSFNQHNLYTINRPSNQAFSAQTIRSINKNAPTNQQNDSSITPSTPSNTPSRSMPTILPHMVVPHLQKAIQKGQKAPIFTTQPPTPIKACLGWNVIHNECELDVSAFLLNENNKVIGDDWFVFYGQTTSPDQSTQFHIESQGCRESISIDFNRLNPAVKKVVFVLTINDALEKHLNFSMVKDAYVQIITQNTGAELVSFNLTDYYANITSMMIGEVYLHNNTWKFNAIGNGLAQDLAGLCGFYGVEVDD